MITQTSNPLPRRPSRVASWAAIGSGILGIIAFVCLITFLVMRLSGGNEQTYQRLIKGHDLALILQTLGLIPVAFALRAAVRQSAPYLSTAWVALVVTGISLTVVFLLLSFARIVADVIYMIPQGLIGIWLIAMCRQPQARNFSRGLRRLGTVAGFGLILAAAYPVGYFLFVDPSIFHGPISDDVPPPAGTETANVIFHLMLAVGTFTGFALYPLWTALLGRKLLKAEG